MSAVANGAGVLTTQVNKATSEIAAKAVDTAGKAARKEATKDLSWMVFGDDTTGLRNMTPEQRAVVGATQSQIDDAQFKSLIWLTTPETELTDSDKQIKQMYNDVTAAIGTANLYQMTDAERQQMYADFNMTRHIPGMPWFDINYPPKTEPHEITDQIVNNINQYSNDIIWPSETDAHYKEALAWQASTPILPENAPYYTPLDEQK